MTTDTLSQPTDLEMLERMYGEAWASPLARDLGRPERTVYRWKAQGAVPKAVQAWLRRQWETHPATGAERQRRRAGRGGPGVVPQNCPNAAFHDEKPKDCL